MEWWASLEQTHDEVWRRLHHGVADRKAPARHPVLATASDRGGEARIVVLRAADRANAALEVHTDARSAKVAELAGNPRATLLVWEAKANLQIRLRIAVEVMAGPDAEAAWARVPEAARKVYGGAVAPGQPLAPAATFVPYADQARFAVLACNCAEIETLHLDEDRHRRAVFRRDAAWEGQWVAP